MGMVAQMSAAEYGPTRDCPTVTKMAYPDAVRAKRRARERGMFFYRCECGSFHLTSAPQRQFTGLPTARR